MTNTNSELARLRNENRKLKAENKRLRSLDENDAGISQRVTPSKFKRLGVIFFLGLAVALLVTGNLLFWTGNTIVKNDRFTDSTAPIIQNSEIQAALASYTTTQLFSNVDVSQYISEALPPRADFLTLSIAGQLQSFTESTLQKRMANPEFQQRWNNIIQRSHARLISSIQKNGGDGTININDFYQQLSGELKNTKLSFLADKPLPSKVGSIQIASGDGIKILNQVINHIDRWRTIVVILFLASIAAGVWLSRNRRKVVILLSLWSIAAMMATLIGVRVVVEAVGNKANSEYAGAVRETGQIILNPLVSQTRTILAVFLIVLFIAWLSGPSRSAQTFKSWIDKLFSGKLHSALFSSGENKFTLWVGRYRRPIEWVIVAIVALIALFIRLTPETLLACGLVILILVILVEIAAAPKSPPE